MSRPCARPECGGELHTDPWGTPVQCPHTQPAATDTGRRCPRCDCPDGHEQCEHCKTCPHADGGRRSASVAPALASNSSWTISRALAYAAAIFWGFVLLGAALIALGEGDGINPVIGAGIPALVCTIGSIVEHRTCRRAP